ncbi:glycoside hydrolase family 16 protein [Piloderma croceum F 1598]|uniref:Glycoside hydrolase family 16 protein n=1 Tax=Piloderma croceum (strain F 1598) TaxID=765440 RepID=A0A0C3F023_PILCF|nr:glycoside hydrolase family 16 protein [Piloderma croceum F 1598]
MLRGRLGFKTLEIIDIATLSSAKPIGFDGQPYELVFSEKFEVEKRFYPGDDPYLEAVEIGAMIDLEQYGLKPITTKKGKKGKLSFFYGECR